MKPEDFEHERKFLVEDLSIIDATEEGTSIVQGYLPAANGCSMRVRFYPTLNTYQLTVKGPRRGITRVEHEERLTTTGELALIACGDSLVEKTRIPAIGPDGLGWDIDVFHGANEGLILAELELSDPVQGFEIPTWCGDEVTQDERFYNEQLAKRPFSTWP